MIITPHFVFLNNPRTGSTFARKAIRAAYASSGQTDAVRELILPVTRGAGSSGADHHGTYSQIPNSARHLPVVSTVRHPLTHLVSSYELGLWRRTMAPLAERLELEAFPDLTFEQYLRLQEEALGVRWGIPFERFSIGPLSAHFIQMFSADPGKVFSEIRCQESPTGTVRVSGIRFLRQESLRGDLAAYLGRCGLDTLAVHHHADSHVTKKSRTWNASSFSPDMLLHAMTREKFMLGALRRAGIDYNPDNASFSSGS